MPFDAPTEVKAEIRILHRMEELLATPEKWCKHENRIGERRCLIGALEDSNGLQHQEAIIIALRQGLPQHYRWLTEYNDRPQTTHADILNLIDKARQKILEGT